MYLICKVSAALLTVTLEALLDTYALRKIDMIPKPKRTEDMIGLQTEM